MRQATEMSNTSNEPIFATKNGYGDMVVMSISVYEQELAKAEMYAKIMEGKAQADNGDLVEGKTALDGLRKKNEK